MKKALSIIIFLSTIIQGADLKKAAEELNNQHLELNKKINSQRHSIFNERQELSTRAESLKNKSLNLEINELKEEIQQLNSLLDKALIEKDELSSELEEASHKAVEMRRSLETRLPHTVDLGFSKIDQALKEDNLSDYTKYIHALTDKVLKQGSLINLQNAKVSDSQGQIHTGKRISIGFTAHYYQYKNNSGIGSYVTGSDYPQLRNLKGVAPAFKNIDQSESISLPLDFSGGLAFKEEAREKTLKEHLKAGGIIIYPLLALGLICLLISLYKILQLYSVKSEYDDKVIELLTLIKNDELEAAEVYVAGLKKPVKSLLGEGLKYRDSKRQEIEELLNESILTELPRLDRLMHILSVSAGAAPLMGLLGTVMGIIKTFEMIGIYGTADANRLSLGISEALVTTEVGLVVAIPTLIVHAILNRRLRTIVANLEKAGLSFINGLKS